jgi:hypothetical protein
MAAVDLCTPVATISPEEAIAELAGARPTIADAIAGLGDLKARCKTMLAANSAPDGKVSSEGAEWKLEKEAGGITIHSAEATGTGLRRFRAVTRLPCSPKYFRDSCIDNEERIKWDAAVGGHTGIKGHDECDAHTTIWRLVVNGAFGVSQRDFVDVATIELDGEGHVWAFGCSLSADDIGSDGCVRGVNYPGSGWHVRPVTDEATGEAHCECTYIVLTDLKGWLLSGVVNMAMTGQFQDFFRLAKAHVQKRKDAGIADDG